MKALRYTVLLLFSILANHLYGQNIENLSRVTPFRFSGNLYLSGNSYSNFGSDPDRTSPYSYTIIGSPVFTIYGISLPFSFAFSDQQFSYSQPFNIYGLSPNYKWATLHLGYRSMHFSSFTLSGRQFYGVGTELTPGKFRIAALYGSLRDLYAQRDTLTFGSNILDTYKRKVHGLKIGYGEKSKIELSYLKVRDDESSGMIQKADNTYLFPEDNLVLGMKTEWYLFKFAHFYLESAASLHTSNQEADLDIDDKTVQEITNRLSGIIEVNASTRWGFAGKTGLDLNFRNFGIGVSYLRVDPFFKSLGLYYMNTDYENYTANTNIRLFKNALRINLTAGYQQNNLSDLKQQTDLRKIGSVNISYFSSKGLSLILNYSNYQTDQSAGYIQIDDSLKLALVNELAFFSPSYSWESGNLNHAISLNTSYQKFLDVNKYRSVKLINDHSYNGSLDYTISINPIDANFNTGINYFQLVSEDYSNSQVGISLGAGKKLFKKKLLTRLNGSWNRNYYNRDPDGITANIRFIASYKLMKNQGLSLNTYYLLRTGTYQRNINEIRASLNYSLSF